MSHALKGKTVVITGASSGIGRASALEFARRGANLVIGARRGELLEEVARGCRELGVSCTAVGTDVAKRVECKRRIGTAGNVDVLVYNAGFATYDSISEAQ